MFSKDVSSTARYLYRTALPTDVKMSPAFAIVNAGAGFVMDELFMPYADKMIQVNGFSGWEPPPRQQQVTLVIAFDEFSRSDDRAGPICND